MLDPTDKQTLYAELRAAMIGRANAKLQAAGLQSMNANELVSADLNDAATFLSEVVYDKFITPLLRSMDNDEFIVNYLIDALGDGADEVMDAAQDAWKEQRGQVPA